MSVSKLTIAFTCVGRRVQLVRHFRRACVRLGVAHELLGLDTNPARSPAAYYCDEAIVVPAGGAAEFRQAVVDVIANRHVGLIIPLADWDLVGLAEVREQIADLGCLPGFSGPKTVQRGRDKLLTFEFFSGLGLSTPRTMTLREALADRSDRLPAFVKPRFGGAGKNAYRVDSWGFAEALASSDIEYVFQSMLDGQEVTVDVFVDEKVRARCAVPRRRLEIRGGEVTKAKIDLDSRIIRQVMQIAEAFPDAFGVMNVQGFIQPDGQVAWTELNPRFGGGSPLSIEAGAEFPLWLVSLALGTEPDYSVSIRDGVTMLRFDDAVYLDAEAQVRRGADAEALPQPMQSRQITG